MKSKPSSMTNYKEDQVFELAQELKKLTNEERDNLKYHVCSGRKILNGPDAVVKANGSGGA